MGFGTYSPQENFVKSFSLFFAVLVLLVGSASSQVTVNGSYEFSRVYTAGQAVNSNPGWNVSLNIPVSNSFGLLSQFAGTDANIGGGTVALNTLGEGIQFQPFKGHFFRPYANFTLGDARFSVSSISVNKLEETAGGGVDFFLSKHWAVRAGLEYLHTSLPYTSSGLNGVRPVAGLTFAF